MTQLRKFVAHTTHDLRDGRQSWRVLSVLCSGALAASVVMTLILR